MHTYQEKETKKKKTKRVLDLVHYSNILNQEIGRLKGNSWAGNQNIYKDFKHIQKFQKNDGNSYCFFQAKTRFIFWIGEDLRMGIFSTSTGKYYEASGDEMQRIVVNLQCQWSTLSSSPSSSGSSVRHSHFLDVGFFKKRSPGSETPRGC